MEISRLLTTPPWGRKVIMITLWSKSGPGREAHFFSFSREEKNGLLYMRNIERYEAINLPQELFRIKFIAGKNISSTNWTKNKLWLHLEDRRKKGSALFLLTSLGEKSLIKEASCDNIVDKNEWYEYLKETDDLDFLSPPVQEVSSKILKGFPSNRNENSYRKARSSFDWTRDNISYSILPLCEVEKMAKVIQLLPKNNRDVYSILRASFRYLPADKLMEISSRVIIPDEITDPYKQAHYITTTFGPLWKIFSYLWEGKKTRSASRTILDKVGKCDCISHVFVALCRSMGVPAMIVKGYFCEDGYHAWAAVYISPYGWVEVDPTGGRFLCHFNHMNYFYEFLRPEFCGEKYIISLKNPLNKDWLVKCKTFYENADGHPPIEEIKAILYGV